MRRPTRTGCVRCAGWAGGAEWEALLQICEAAAGAQSAHGDPVEADQRLHPAHGSLGSLVGLGLTAPEAELASFIGSCLGYCQPDERDTAAWTVPAPDAAPAIELPANAVDHIGRAETEPVTPPPAGRLAVLGFGADLHAHQRLPCPGQLGVELIRQGLGHERHRVEPVSGRIDLGFDAELELGGSGLTRPEITPAGQAVRPLTLGAEPADQVGDGQGCHVAQGAQAQPPEHIGEIAGCV